MHDRYNKWTFRLASPLGFGSEFWKPMEDHPAFARLVARGESPEVAKWMITDSLLREVVWAAGVMEYTAEKLFERLDAAERWVDKYVDKWSVDKPEPPATRGVSTGEIMQARVELFNLLTWTRALIDRLERDRGRLGLLPSMSATHPITPRVQNLVYELRPKIVGDARRLTAFVLHSASIPYPDAGAELDDESRIVVPIPDTPMSRVEHWQELTYEQGREIRPFVQELLSHVERFIDDLLDIFEEAWRERVARQQHASE
jgi:hypothetical protein